MQGGKVMPMLWFLDGMELQEKSFCLGEDRD
jgi:hypothetical protein